MKKSSGYQTSEHRVNHSPMRSLPKYWDPRAKDQAENKITSCLDLCQFTGTKINDLTLHQDLQAGVIQELFLHHQHK